MNVKYQIFVSSSYEDLRNERNEVIKACLSMGHIPVGMEMSNAGDEEQWAVITRTIDQCDYYVVIIAHRYGSTTAEGISFTEKEYDYAVTQGVPVLGFVVDEKAPWPSDRIDKNEPAVGALTRFKSKVQQRMVRFWQTAPELRSQFVESLATTVNLNPRRGWIRAPEASDTDIAQAFSNLSDENARLRRDLKDLQSTANQGSDTDAMVAALRRIAARQEGEHSRKIDGVALFPLFARGIREGNIWAKAEEAYAEIQRGDMHELTQELVTMGLLKKESSIHPFSLTPLGSKVYARLVSR